MKLTIIISMLFSMEISNGQTLNPRPAVSAGTDEVIQYPKSATMLQGAAMGVVAEINKVYWEQVIGSRKVSILKPDSIATFVTGLEAGRNYLFKLTATDKLGNSSIDFVTITVQK